MKHGKCPQENLYTMMDWAKDSFTQEECEYWRYRTLNDLKCLPLLSIDEACFYSSVERGELVQAIRHCKVDARKFKRGDWAVVRTSLEKAFGIAAELQNPCPPSPYADEDVVNE
ncbi:MAG TPA: hypothetical protein VN622_05910 [Clostridia bacterium]|nr:hypothetical protein [Clostridia bacterium]